MTREVRMNEDEAAAVAVALRTMVEVGAANAEMVAVLERLDATIFAEDECDGCGEYDPREACRMQWAPPPLGEWPHAEVAGL